MKNWTIGKRITAGFASVIIIVLALGVFAYSRLLIIRNHSDEITNKAIPSIKLVFHVQRNVKDSCQIVYKHIGSSDKEDMAQLEGLLTAASADNAKLYAELDKLVTDEKGHALLDGAQSARTEYNQHRSDILALSRGGTNNALAYSTARTLLDPAADKYIKALDNLIDYINATSDDASKAIQTSVQNSQAGILVGLILAFLVGIGVAFVIIRGTGKILNRVASELNDGSNQVASAAGQVSTASQSLAEGSSEQAASIEETSASLEEMSSMTKRNAENAQKANDLAKQARSAADKGSTDMQTMSAAMEAIKVSSDDIAKIIKTIDEIAFQTNILALNAAVEAARAGEAGMGFAVVADEVRNLAQRSAQAAKETAAKIEGAITKTGQGVEISSKVVQTLNDIVTKVRQVDELITEVASASREQTQGITQINTAVGQMDKVTQSNAANAEESAAAAQELNGQAATMKQSVNELLQLVGGTGQEAASRPMVASAAPIRPKATVAHRSNGNGHVLVAPKASNGNGRHSEIPMEGDFKDF